MELNLIEKNILTYLDEKKKKRHGQMVTMYFWLAMMFVSIAVLCVTLIFAGDSLELSELMIELVAVTGILISIYFGIKIANKAGYWLKVINSIQETISELNPAQSEWAEIDEILWGLEKKKDVIYTGNEYIKITNDFVAAVHDTNMISTEIIRQRDIKEVSSKREDEDYLDIYFYDFSNELFLMVSIDDNHLEAIQEINFRTSNFHVEDCKFEKDDSEQMTEYKF